jgi:hypothetical protein
MISDLNIFFIYISAVAAVVSVTILILSRVKW